MQHRHTAFVSVGLTALVTALALLAAFAAMPAHAQGPQSGPQSGSQTGRGYQGDVPGGGGWGLLLMDQEMTRDQLMLQVRDQDCTPTGLGWFAGGRWATYIEGAPAWVNADFPLQLHAGDIYAVSCDSHDPVVLRLTDANNGGAYQVAAGARFRVALNANPSTGYTWTVNPVPDAAVVTQIGDPFFVPVSNLVGASGHQVFDLRAVGAGTVQLRLEYARPFESVPPAQTWSATITVTP